MRYKNFNNCLAAVRDLHRAQADALVRRPERPLSQSALLKGDFPDRCLIDFLTSIPSPGANGCLRGHRTAHDGVVSEPS
jgi:hypothetical protein